MPNSSLKVSLWQLRLITADGSGLATATSNSNFSCCSCCVACVEPNSGLGNAFRYLLKRWQKLTRFLRVPKAPLENNICERARKMAIRHRNNSLFYRSELVAKVADVYMTLIHTAELHHQNPFDYVTALLEHEALVAADPKSWLPWNYPNARARASPDAAAA